MKERKCYKAIISSCVLVLCMAFVALFAVMPTKASDKTVKTEPLSSYSESDLKELIKNQKTAGYLYAGLFKSGTKVENLTKANAVATPQDGESYEVKFVPAGVLGINAQVSDALLEDESYSGSSIRVVTAVDSLTYKEVGFSVVRADTKDNLVAEGSITKYVYTELYAVDATDKSGGVISYTPQDIHASANYFKTYTITGVPAKNYNTDLIVTPYWVTYDDEIVYGSESIKTVNLGRSWVYINTSANTDGYQYGTYDHPYTNLADALDAIVLDKSGKIVIQNDSTIKLPKTFTWSKHGKDLTITGEGEKTETLDFSAITNFRMGDSVTFENMTLKLPTSQLYADGHRFKIAENVVSNNSGVIIFGGGNGNDVTGDTSVTLLSGSYEAVYGGGLNGDVDGDTYVTIRNSNIYDDSTDTANYVCGGGRKGNVTGNTHVTIGEGFNKDLKWNDHSTLSLVCGGGYGADGNISTVGKNTYVIIEDSNKEDNISGANINYVYGAGVSYSNVKGKCHVTCDGGNVMSIYGGGSSVQAANSSTSVVMKDGQVEQIFGGNRIGMTGNADVHILGGNILRRVYGGCYNDYDGSWKSTSEVNGYVSVTFGPDTYATLAMTYSGGDCAYLASSRYDSTITEKGVFVVNDYYETNNPNVSKVGHSTYFTTISPYHYLVQATTGGAVYSEGDSIRVIPDENKVATVRINSAETGVGTVHAYLTSEGVCKLPSYDSTVDSQSVYVVFTDETPNDVIDYKATVNGVPYTTLEEALNEANTLSTTTEQEVVVNLLQENITVDSTLSIAKSANIVIQNADGVTATVNRADGLMSSNLLNVADGAKLTVKGVVLDGRKTDELMVTDIDLVTGGSAQLVKVSGDLIIDGATIQYAKNSVEGSALYVDGGNVTMNGGSVSNNYASGKKSGGAVSLNNSSTFTMKNGTISYNTAEEGSGGAFIVRTSSKLNIEKGTISYNEATVSGANGGGAIFAHHSTTVNVTGGTMSYNKAASGNGGAILAFKNGTGASNVTIQNATILNNTSKNGGAIYVVAGAGLTLNGGVTFTENSATVCGDDIYLGDKMTLKQALSDTIAVGPSTYVVEKVIIVNGGMTEDEFKASMEKITVDAYEGQQWSVNDNGALEPPILLDGVSYANLDVALANVAEESTITLYQNQELSSPVTVEGTLTITCIDNVTITASENFTGYMFNVAERGKLVITGASTEKKITLSGENVASRGIDSSGTLGLTNVVVKQAIQNVRINKGTAALQGVDIRAFEDFGLVVKNGTVTVTDMVIDNVDVTVAKNRFGIAAHGGTLNLAGVTIQNLVGIAGKDRASFAIDHTGGILNVTADAAVDGENKGLYIYNIEGFGINSKGGTFNIAEIEIDGNSTTRAGIRLVNNANENKVTNAKITGCSVQIQLQKESKLTIGETTVYTTGSDVANYDTDGTQQ